MLQFHIIFFFFCNIEEKNFEPKIMQMPVRYVCKVSGFLSISLLFKPASILLGIETAESTIWKVNHYKPSDEHLKWFMAHK